MSETTLDYRVPDVIGEVAGFRAWGLQWCGRMPALFSITAGACGVPLANTVWPTNRWFEAICPVSGEYAHPAGEIPYWSCRCGIYAARSFEQLIGLSYGAYGSYEVDDKVVGEIAGCGKVIEGSQGWRMQRARVVSLKVGLSKAAWVEPLQRAYKVPVEMIDWREIGWEHGD